MTRIRTLDFLPEIFQTPTNEQFLSATLDQLVNPPVTRKIQGFVGSTIGYGVNANDFYVTEPTKVRKDYQLEPGVVFLKNNQGKANDFLSYPGILDALKLQYGLTNNNNDLFESQFYSWDSFTDLDKIINFNQYYWLPQGPPAVVVTNEVVYLENQYDVVSAENSYQIKPLGATGYSDNPTLTLIRGGTYTFNVNQDSQFWIQGAPGINGTSLTQPNFSVRLTELGGVINNGAESGTITFNVPAKDAMDQYNYEAGVGVPAFVVSTKSIEQIQNLPLSQVGNIDGVTALNGINILFYNADTETITGTFPSDNFYKITYDYSSSPVDPIVTLAPDAVIYNEEKITPSYGSTYIGIGFVKTTSIAPIPFISAPLDTLYYQDSVNPNKVGIIKLIENNDLNTLDVETQILGKKSFTSSNGIKFTNGLKVSFSGDIIPTSYQQGEYYVEGVGTSIELIPTTALLIPESFTTDTSIAYDMTNYDIENYDEALNLPLTPDYITIARNSINKNAWSRSNRWFHSQVISDTAVYNGNPNILNLASSFNKAKRPILEFYPNLRLFNSGTVGKESVDFIDTRTTDALSTVAGQAGYYPDVSTYTAYTGSIATNPTVNCGDFIVGEQYKIANLGTTDVTIWEQLGATLGVDGQFVVGQEYIIWNLGSTSQAAWNKIAGTTGVTYAKNSTFKCAYPGEIIGSGGGQAFNVLFTALISGLLNSSDLVSGLQYTIVSVGSTLWNNIGYVGTPTVGGTFTATAPAVGTGTAIQGNGTALAQTNTTITIPTSDITGTLSAGMYINDLILGEQSKLPVGTRIFDIISGTTTTTMTVNWPTPTIVLPTSGDASFVASIKNNADLALFSGARVVFSADTNPEVSNKIFVANFSTTISGSYPVLTFTEALDGEILTNDQFAVLRGQNNEGVSWYYDEDELGVLFHVAQQKIKVNQPPKFDVFDKNGISFGDTSIYKSTTFQGCELFNYKVNLGGVNDTILGFPITFSSIRNTGDISFEVSLNVDEFNYVTGLEQNITETEKVNTGYVYNTTGRLTYERLLGWQTAVAPSTQYQVFEFPYTPPNVVLTSLDATTLDVTVTCDVPQLNVEDTIWPSIQVFNNNNLITDYTVQNTETSTSVTVNIPALEKTVIQVLILSDKVSTQAFYTIPINLSNNPFNTDITSVDVGDIRGQYQSIFYNNPDTTGDVFGANNTRDLGNLVPWGNRIIQNSASLVIPGAFLRQKEHNLFEALLFNSREYVKFKSLLVDTANKIDWQQRYDAGALLDYTLDIISSVKNQEMPFFWSDMIPNKAPYISNVYNFFNNIGTTTFGLSKVYNYETANYNGILVYLKRKVQGTTVTELLYKNIDYTVSKDSPSLTITKDLITGDQVIINEYNQTYGSYVPNTPSKLGLYPVTVPKVIYDETYITPTYFIVGHDGSYTKLYGQYSELYGLTDYRDQVLFEFEKRVYNNIKLSSTIPINAADIIPNYYKDTTEYYNNWLTAYSPAFLDWVGNNKLDYKDHIFTQSNSYTYNYRDSGAKVTGDLLLQGNWRGIYIYYFSTSTPATTPWEMIGYANKPAWWDERYGPSPYTSDNLILWADMFDGIDYNNGNPITLSRYKKSNFTRDTTEWDTEFENFLLILPVNEDGSQKSPLNSIVGTYDPSLFADQWIVGDLGPVEFSYRRSSTWPFDLVRLGALLKPANFFNLAVDLDNYKYNAEFNQYLVNDRSHLVPNQIQIYGNGTAKTSYINWIVDYEKQLGVDATTNITNLFKNIDVRLVYRLAGFSDKTLLKFFVEKGTPNSSNSSLLIPDENFSVLLYENQPYTKIIYSAVSVEKVPNGYRVDGFSQNINYFSILKPINNGNVNNIIIQDLSVKVAKDYTDKVEIVEYGSVFRKTQDLAQFLASYGRYLISQGCEYELIESGVQLDWNQMIGEFLYWAQIGFVDSSVITLNPAANTLAINAESLIVQPLSIHNNNFILNQNLYPIENRDLSIVREGTSFSVTALKDGDTISYGQFNLSNIEHGIVFDNKTIFNDVIYNLITGLKQNRIYLQGTKSAEWNGTMNASGFIYNQDNIREWTPAVKYTKGEIVSFKNKYWTALKIVQPSKTFTEADWKETDYDEVQKGLLPNSSTRSYESSLYYNVNEANLEKDADQLSFSLIGYRSRPYMVSADLTDITQVNVYKNMIKEKGTRAILDVFKGADLPQGGIDYDLHENWAILNSVYGGVLQNNFIEFKLNQSKLTNNPSIIGLTNGNPVQQAQEIVPIYSLFNYGKPITNPDVLPTLNSNTPNTIFPDAGYVNFNDVKMSSYFFSGFPAAVNEAGLVVPLNKFYVGDYAYVANYLANWNVLTPNVLGQVIGARSNLNGTTTIFFRQAQTLQINDIFAIINFNDLINGYFTVLQVVSPYQVIIPLNLSNSTLTLTGEGIAYQFVSQRVAQPSDIQDLLLLNNEFVSNKVWVDTNNDGGWAVYRKGINYEFDIEFTKDTLPDEEKNDTSTFGSAVSYTTQGDFLFSDAGMGRVFRYQYDPITEVYDPDQIIEKSTSFGTTIVKGQNIFAISQPVGTPKVFLYYVNDTYVTDDINPLQEISAPVGCTNFGSSMAMSGDSNWLFISDFDDAEPVARNNVHVYRRINGIFNANELVNGTYYEIISLGANDFTNVGAPENKVGIIFQATGPLVSTAGTFVIGEQYTISSLGTTDWSAAGWLPTNVGETPSPGDTFTAISIGSGTGTAIPFNQGTVIKRSYEFITTIAGPTVTIDKFGSSITTNYYGDVVTIGAPNEDFDASTENWGKAYYYSRSIQNFETQTASTNDPTTFQLAWTPDPSKTVNVYLNGVLVDESNYSISGSSLIYSGTFVVGDIIKISGNKFTLNQILTTETTPRIGVGFGTSIDNNRFATEILVGAPFALSSENEEGAVYRYTNAGARFGNITGTSTVDTTANRKLLINGYEVTIPVDSDAELAALAINTAQITNITATAINNKLNIQLIKPELGVTNQQIVLTSTDVDTFAELGIDVLTQTQVIQCPHLTGPTQFGTVVKFNEFNSVAISAPVGTRYAQTTFDFIDDLDFTNDTIFDNNATQFIDTYTNAGAVYLFDYLSNYRESLNNIGAFTYAQSTNDKSQVYGSQPRYGTALDFTSNKVIIGTPGYRPDDIDGQVVVYINQTGLPNWKEFRQTNEIVDISKIDNSQIFSAELNQTLTNLDYFDPLQGKLLGAIRQNIDVISNIDPASYNNDNNTQSGFVWGSTQVGTVWFDTSNVRFVNYHQNDNAYNAKYWGTLFPGSDVAIYSWIASAVPPSEYEGSGTPRNIDLYSVQTVLNASNTIEPVYFFWVKNSGIKFRNKSLADVNVANYILNPLGSGISYIAPLLPNTFALYNCQQYINANDSVLHIGYSSANNTIQHEEYQLIRENFANDFLPGVPNFVDGNIAPRSLYDRLIDSLGGTDEVGAVVPDPFLPKTVQSGILARPRQSFFYNRLKALQNYLEYSNSILKQFPIVEIRPRIPFLFKSGEFYDTSLYWEYVNWWVPGYNDNTKAIMQVPAYNDLLTLEVAPGSIVTVLENGQGNSETYIYTDEGKWNRIGLQNGTVRFKSELWDYSSNNIGFGSDFYGSQPFDNYPSEETRWIIRALNEQIFTDELLIFRNRSLILLFNYIQAESYENQNYLPWLNKTSLIDVSHKIRDLKPIQNFQNDNQDFLSGYLNEAKPYHVVIKEFLLTYTGIDWYQGNITDFDLPAEYSFENQSFISPELVYTNPTLVSEYLPNNAIWTTQSYSEWRNNYGLSLIGQNDYNISTLRSYVTLNSDFIIVDNVSGFPVTGTIKVSSVADPNVYELIGYTQVNRDTNSLSGLIRGVNGTEIAYHIPGENIFIDLPAIVILDTGKGYTNPPKVTAFIDTAIYPEPREEAVLEAVMRVDKVIGVNVINPGSGYAVLPRIIIDSAYDFTVDSTNIAISPVNTLELYAPELVTGDLIRYVSGEGTEVGGLENNQWYYVRVLDNVPTTIIALYTSYADAIYGAENTRVKIFSQGTGSHTFKLGAKAAAVSSSYPVRENNITLRYDRTSYNTQIVDWEANSFYGSFFAGSYNNTENIASSSITLESTLPDIANMLSSNQGLVLPISEISNYTQPVWSEFERSVESTISTGNKIRLKLNTSTENASGSTIGFVENMLVGFAGDLGTSGLQAFDIETKSGTVYYIAEVINDTDFTIKSSLTGPVVTLNSLTISGLGVRCYTGQDVSTAVIATNYPGIRTATATSSTNNIVTVPLTTIGQGGSQGLYTGIPIEFVGNVFGGIEENIVYFVTSVIDKERFTISASDSFTRIKALYIVSGNQIVVQNTTGLSVGDQIVFSNMTINGNQVTNFGNIVAGNFYYVKSIGINTITISTTLGGAVFTVTTVASSSNTYCFFVSQENNVELTSATGNMTVNVQLPASPGQVNGQQFIFYSSSQEFENITSINYGNLVESSILKTVPPSGSVPVSQQNYMILDRDAGGIQRVYKGLPITVGTSIGGLTAGTAYYVNTFGNVTLQGTSSSSSDNTITVSLTTTTTNLMVDMPIVISNFPLGGLQIGQTYYVHSIVDLTNFKVKATLTGGVASLVNTVGTATITGAPYITVSDTYNGAIKTLSPGTGPVDLVQKITEAPTFDIGYRLGGYTAIISSGGKGFTVDNTISIAGNLLGGTTPSNDLTIVVNQINPVVEGEYVWSLPLQSEGNITSVNCQGNPNDIVESYYLKVAGANTFNVYSDPRMTVPVSADDLAFVGYTVTTATNVTASDDRVTVTSSTDFNVNDPVVFTGTMFSNEIVLGQIYYIYDKPTSTTVRLTNNPGGTVINFADDANGSMTMATAGSFMFLPEPFYFTPSIVKFNNKTYVCVVSNNDSDFNIGKWEELDSGDRRLNALDRAFAYYQPDVNMPGDELTQLFTGLTYPNTVYQGNAFDPADQFTVDTILQDQEFYPTGVNVEAITFNGVNYIAPANLPNSSVLAMDIEVSDNWLLGKLSDYPLGLTDIINNNGIYVMTTTNSATPIMKSVNGYVFSSNGYFIPYDTDPVDIPYEKILLTQAELSLHSVIYHNNKYIAAGNTLLLSDSTGTVWTEVYKFDTDSGYFYDVSYVNTSFFTGYVAVGTDNSTKLIVYSTDGTTWTKVSSSDYIGTANNSTLNSVTYNNNVIVVVGNNGTVYQASALNAWTLILSSGKNLNDVICVNNVFTAVGDDGVVKVSTTNGTSWTERATGTLNDLNVIYYETSNATYTIGGDDNTLLQTSNTTTDPVVWDRTQVFALVKPVYTVQGDPFQAGYGPEELVPGVVSDQLTMIVTTRAGTNWSATQYAHVGYNVVSIELDANADNVYSFADVVQVPACISVYIIGSDGLCTTIYEGNGYTSDYVNKTIELDTNISDPEKLRIDVYEVGNGDQLIKSSTQINPLIENSATGFQEVFLNCNYSAFRFTTGGIIKPATDPIDAQVFSTDNTTNTMVVDDASLFILNSAIYFTGDVFGGVVANTNYYVKSINLVRNSISISSTLVDGIAGPIFDLTTDSGSNMQAVIQNGPGQFYTEPAVFHNGIRLLSGISNTVIKTKSSNNALVTYSTVGLVANQQIVFDKNIFGNLNGNQVYYVKTIIDDTQFTVSLTAGGSTVTLINASGVSNFITNDYAVTLAINQINANLVFATDYDTAVDYISFSFFNETDPEQYGYTVPEIETFNGDGTTGAYTLSNYMGEGNATNAIVEVDGLRIMPNQYTIYSGLNSLVFDSIAPDANSTISVISFNDTKRQYFNTQYETTSKYVTPIDNVENTFSFPLLDTQTAASVGGYFIAASTTGMVLGQSVMFQVDIPGSTPVYAGFGGVRTDGTVYTLSEINTVTNQFKVQDQYGTTYPTVNQTGLMHVVVGGQPTVRIETSDAHHLDTNDVVRIDGLTGSIQLNNNVFYVHVITDNIFDIYLTEFSPYVDGINEPVTLCDAYVSGGYVWLDQSWMLETTAAVECDTTQITALSVVNLIVNTPITFTESNVLIGESTSIPEIIAGNIYYIRSIDYDNNSFTISETPDGNILTLTSTGGTSVWTVNHDLNTQFVSVTPIYDSNVAVTGRYNYPEIYYNNANTCTITFDQITPGYATIVGDSSNVSGYYLHEQSSASTTWTVNHNLNNQYVVVAHANVGDYSWYGKYDGAAITYTNANSLTLTFNSAQAGNVAVISDSDLVGYYKHTQTTPSTTWTVNHNLETQYLSVTPVYPNNLSMVSTYNFPEIVYNNEDTLTLTFTSPQTGNVIVVGGGEGSYTQRIGTNLRVSQWVQTNVDRLWVTVNGKRVPSSLLKLNPGNQISILTPITSGDEIIITSMMPSASPDEDVYINMVDKNNQGAVYRANAGTRTWINKPLSEFDTIIPVEDASNLISLETQSNETLAEELGYYYITVNGSKTGILNVSIYNETKGQFIESDYISIIVESAGAVLKITAGLWIEEDDILTIDIDYGNSVYINGEYMQLLSVDTVANEITVRRGILGTSTQTYIPKYATVYGLLDNNRMSNIQYSKTWNTIPGDYDASLGDPLQIASSTAAEFLRMDV